MIDCSNVLITLPHHSFHGGVGNIYKSLKWQKEDNVSYFYNTKEKKSVDKSFFLLMLLRFIICIQKMQIVHLNPSLNLKATIRDGILIVIAKTFKKKVIVFFHGWDDDFQDLIKKNKLYKWLFDIVFNKVDCFILLGEIFTDKMKILGVNPLKVYYLPTIADNKFYNEEILHDKLTNNKHFHLLFIGGFVPSKGVEIVLATFKFLCENNLDFSFTLTMAGDGPELNKCKLFVIDKNLQNVTFTGYIEGIQKHNCYRQSDILLLPSLSEGLPCVIMEGMLYGLAIVTRPIGGIPNWVKHNLNGWLTESTDPEEFAKGIMSLIRDPKLIGQISRNNQIIAKENFTPEKIKDKLKTIYNDVIYS